MHTQLTEQDLGNSGLAFWQEELVTDAVRCNSGGDWSHGVTLRTLVEVAKPPCRGLCRCERQSTAQKPLHNLLPGGYATDAQVSQASSQKRSSPPRPTLLLLLCD
jgi:hypothetical protein